MPADTDQPLRTPKLSDSERLALARFREGGQQSAFQDLLRPHLGALRALARRVTGDFHWADDLVQETLVRAFRGLGAFRGDSGVRTWVFRILIRLSKDPGRWRRSERAGSLDVEVPDAFGGLPEDGVLERELRERLEEALERLTPRQRAAFHLRAVEGMDYRGVAAALDCTAVAARMLVLNARRKVMERMEGHLNHE